MRDALNRAMRSADECGRQYTAWGLRATAILAMVGAQAMDETPADSIFNQAYAKLLKDFEFSCLRSPKIQLEQFNLLDAALRAVPTLRDHEHMSFVPTDAWSGRAPSSDDLRLLAEYTQHVGGPIRICCTAIHMGTVMTLRTLDAMVRLSSGGKDAPVALYVSSDQASGKEVISAITERPDRFDFIATADAATAFYHQQGSVAGRFERMFLICRQNQYLMRKPGNPRLAKPTLYLYERSSAEHQARLKKEFPILGSIPESRWIRLDSMLSLVTLPHIMMPGDLTIAWEPFSSTLQQIHNMVPVNEHRYLMPTSLFARQDARDAMDQGQWRIVVKAFARAFIAVWNALSDDTRRQLPLQKIKLREPLIGWIEENLNAFRIGAARTDGMPTAWLGELFERYAPQTKDHNFSKPTDGPAGGSAIHAPQTDNRREMEKTADEIWTHFTEPSMRTGILAALVHRSVGTVRTALHVLKRRGLVIPPNVKGKNARWTKVGTGTRK